MIREHHRGRALDEILEDAYVTNRCSRRAGRPRCSTGPTSSTPIGDDIVAARRAGRRRAARARRPTPALAGELDARAPPTARSQAAMPFDLKTTMSVARRRGPGPRPRRPPAARGPRASRGRRARPARSGRRTRAATARASRSRRRRRARARRCRARGAPGRSRRPRRRAHRREPFSAQDRVLRAVVTVTTMSCSAASLVRLGRLAVVGAAELGEPLADRGSRPTTRSTRRQRRRGCRRSATAACQPQPITPRLAAPSRARWRAATAEAAPVRSCPSLSASITAVEPRPADRARRAGRRTASRVPVQAYVFSPAYPSSRSTHGHRRRTGRPRAAGASAAGCRRPRARAGRTSPRPRRARPARRQELLDVGLGEKEGCHPPILGRAGPRCGPRRELEEWRTSGMRMGCSACGALRRAVSGRRPVHPAAGRRASRVDDEGERGRCGGRVPEGIRRRDERLGAEFRRLHAEEDRGLLGAPRAEEAKIAP